MCMFLNLFICLFIYYSKRYIAKRSKLRFRMSATNLVNTYYILIFLAEGQFLNCNIFWSIYIYYDCFIIYIYIQDDLGIWWLQKIYIYFSWNTSFMFVNVEVLISCRRIIAYIVHNFILIVELIHITTNGGDCGYVNFVKLFFSWRIMVGNDLILYLQRIFELFARNWVSTETNAKNVWNVKEKLKSNEDSTANWRIIFNVITKIQKFKIFTFTIK